MHVLRLLTLFQIAKIINGLVAYDCGTRSTNLTTISLLNVKPCNIQLKKPIVTETSIKLLQLSRFNNVHVKLCRIELNRIIYHCGMWSHNSVVHNGYAGYLLEISPEICKDMHENLKYRYGDILFTGIYPNSTVEKPAVLAGSVSSDGDCEDGQFNDQYGSWDEVVVQGRFKITLADYYAPVSVDENQVYLRQGTRCDLSKNRCLDSEGNSVFWNSSPNDECHLDEYNVLYEGVAQRIYDNSTSNEDVEEVFSVQNGDIVFGLSQKGFEHTCGYVLIRTEHPKLFILETKKESMGQKRKPIAVNNLDLMSYVNSKFVYVEKHFGKQLKNLYIDVLTQKCELERQVIENSLLLAYSKPAEFALRVMKSPGYMANIAGEVIHIVKCHAIPAVVARLPTCYGHLPVIANNETMIVTPHTHILLKKSPKVDCNAFIAPMYFIEGTWIRLNPMPSPAMAPTELEPLTKPNWRYENLESLATSGIYSSKDLEKLQDHLMFPEEQPAVIDAIARGAMGESVYSPGVEFSNFFDENSIDKIADRVSVTIWGWLTGFGTFSAGLIGLFMIGKIIKFIIDTFIHGYALHRLFGWSFWLVGAIWDSLTNLLLHFKTKVEEDNIKEEEEEGSEKGIPKAPAEEGPCSSTIYPELKITTEGGYRYHHSNYN